MSILLRSSEINKLPVVTFAGEDIAQVKDIMYAAHGGQVLIDALCRRFGLWRHPAEALDPSIAAQLSEVRSLAEWVPASAPPRLIAAPA